MQFCQFSTIRIPLRVRLENRSQLPTRTQKKFPAAKAVPIPGQTSEMDLIGWPSASAERTKGASFYKPGAVITVSSLM